MCANNLEATPTGTLETVPGFEPAFKANVNFGADWLSFDADGEHARIDLRGIAKYVPQAPRYSPIAR